MSLHKVVALSANTHRPSRTRLLVQEVAGRFEAMGGPKVSVCDLLDVGLEFGCATSVESLGPAALDVVKMVEGADALIVGSPIYNGGYSGHFKHFFDLIHPQRLRNKPVCITATGGGQRHALAVEMFMRPLFGFFGALTLPSSVYASEQDFDEQTLCSSDVRIRIESAARELHVYC
jgi:FMN reductase